MRAQEGIYQLLFKKAPVGIFHYDTNLCITDCNERFVEILKSSRERLIGLDMKTLKDPSVLPAIKKVLSGEEGIYEGFYRATTGPAEIWVIMRTVPLFDDDGNVVGGVGIVEDITRMKDMEGDLRRSEALYKELSERLTTTVDELKKREERLLQGRDAFLNMLEDINEAYKELEELFMGFVKVMVNTLDAKSHWTRGHSERVTMYAEEIAREMGLDEDEIRDIRLAGLLHDVGKIGTYDHILDKPDRLTDDEFEVVKRHPSQGAQMLEEIRKLRDIIPIIRHHHERYDGRGYPDGLKGEEIPLGARILHVADSFDSMTADRPYRKSPGIEYAISEFKRCSGTQFDPKVVEVFLNILRKRQ
ncbi:MAG: hypothetical protein Fur0020_07760 [Thermodesulfovibrionia bacterium]